MVTRANNTAKIRTYSVIFIVEKVTPSSFHSLRLLGLFCSFVCWLACFVFLLRNANNFVMGLKEIAHWTQKHNLEKEKLKHKR